MSIPRIYAKGVSETMSYETAEQFFEIEGTTVVRQVTRVGDRWFCSLDEWVEPVGGLLTDQPVQEGEFPAEDRMSQAEFEAAWDSSRCAAAKRAAAPGNDVTACSCSAREVIDDNP